MAAPHQVPDQVLAWLYSVLHEYHDPQRTYSDAARALGAFPSLSPRTQIHTDENGREALLLTLAGTIPVNFRGQLYRFPLQLWLPHAYPQESPIVYVSPGKDMAVRPGQHVSVDGRVYHPYLRDWAAQSWDRASLAELLEILQRVFEKEPPVVGKAQAQQQSHPPGATPGPPQLPPKQRPGSNAPPVEAPQARSADGPPPRPPKPGEENRSGQTSRQSTPSRDWSRDGPPLPPLPHQRPPTQHPVPPAQHYQGYSNSPIPQHPQQYPPHTNGDRNGHRLSGVPPTPLAQHQRRILSDRNSPVSPVSPVTGYSELPERTSYPNAPPQPNFQQSRQHPQQFPPQFQQRQYPPHGQNQMPPNQYQPAPQRAQPPPDLLTDPFEIAMPAQQNQNQPAPPIPPNPEKEHLLQALSSTLTGQAQNIVNQNLAARTSLLAQQSALQAAHARLQAEMRQLGQLGQTLDSNERILRTAINDCDSAITAAKDKPAPPIDDVVIPNSLVAQQLWTLCAEDAAGQRAMYMLQQAVDRGRIEAEVFVRVMRALGREAFLRKMLIRRCSKGLGLDISADW